MITLLYRLNGSVVEQEVHLRCVLGSGLQR
jgi:hypothetical protein